MIDPLQLALEVLENVWGNINPERGFADELEADVERAIDAIQWWKFTIAQPAATPEKMSVPDGYSISTGYAQGWNDCIDAMLAVAPKTENKE